MAPRAPARPQRFVSAMPNADAIWRLVEAKRQRFPTSVTASGTRPSSTTRNIAPAPSTPRCWSARAFASRAASRASDRRHGGGGEGGPVIAILGEYDALPGLSQEAGIAEQRPLAGRQWPWLRAQPARRRIAARGRRGQGLPGGQRLSGRVRYYGCPAEEGGSAKGFMVRAGAVRRCGHRDLLASGGVRRRQRSRSRSPATRSTSIRRPRLACRGMAPHLGRSALDAVELMNVGVNYMREHMPSTRASITR